MTVRSDYVRGVTLALLVAASPAAFAQSETTAPQVQADSEGILDIVVTAQKREENLQDTPISIVAFGSESLEQRGVSSLNDLFTGAIPSLRIAPFLGRPSAVSIGMRGLVPVDATQVTRDATVGVYIDNVYLGRVSGLGMELADVERIEVLRGPQGTLFGRNTIGGAVSIVTKRPTGEFSADVRLGISNYRGRSAVAHLNLPEVAGISIKLDGLYEERGGLVLNPNPAFNDYSQIKKYGFKAAALWEPTDTLSVLYSYDISRDKPTSGYADIVASDQPDSLRPSFIKFREGRVRTARIGVPVLENPQKASGHSLVADWEASDNLSVRSITAWRKLNSEQWDQDNGSVTAWGPNRTFGRMSYALVDQNQFSQELQLIGDVGEFQYVLGGYYFNENGRDEAIVYSTARLNATNTDITVFPEMIPDNGVNIPDRAAQVNVKSKALFGQVTWSPQAVEGLHITAGGRYTDDHKKGRLTSIRGVDPNLDFEFSSSRFDPMVTVAYNFDDNVNGYAKISRAYRAGGANTRSFNLTPFGEEELVSYEIGMKADLFDRLLRVNAAAYHSRLSNMQVDFINPAFVSNTETVNAPEKRKISGIELDMWLAPAKGLLFSANYVFTHAPTTQIQHVFTGAIVNVDSNFTPKHALAVTADYTVRPFTFADLRFHLDANTAGNYIANNTVTYKADSAVLVNGRVTLGDISLGGSTLDVAIWGKNLTNAKFRAFDWRTAGRQTTARYNDPITYGLEARLRF